MKKTLVIILWVSIAFELILGLGILLFPTSLMGVFAITTINDELLYLAAIVGWFCLLTTLIAFASVQWIRQGQNKGYILAMILGAFWIGIGLHLALVFQRPQHLILDAAKGLVIFILAYKLEKTASQSST